eukprot:m.180968 g.180968  ORF g.180968 m.180968 type:complete len:211 (+) comp16868_c0_seq2:130-762(+)
MLQLLLLTLGFASALAAVPTTTRANSNKVILGQTLSTDEILAMKRMAHTDDPDKCLRLVDSNQGIKFKNTDSLQGITFQTCPGGRDCARIIRCSSLDPRICFEAQTCYDPAGKSRCTELQACQCLVGDFALASADDGIRFTSDVAMLGDANNRYVDGVTELPVPLIKRERCFDGDTFNIRSCEVMEEGCEAIVPCLQEGDRSCKKLVPGM